jgi:PilZ domain
MQPGSPSVARPPAKGDVVIVRLPVQREISTKVLESTGRNVRLDLPPVLHRGARLDLLWGAKGIAHAAVATVVAPRKAAAGLAVSLGDVYAVERRVLERWRPSHALRVQLALAGGRLVSGEVRNLSLGGFAALVEQPIPPRTPIEVTLFDGNGAPLLFAIEAEVRRSLEEAPDSHLISVAFLSRGMVAMTLARLR